jgi:hypothetical protein
MLKQGQKVYGRMCWFNDLDSPKKRGKFDLIQILTCCSSVISTLAPFSTCMGEPSARNTELGGADRAALNASP